MGSRRDFLAAAGGVLLAGCDAPPRALPRNGPSMRPPAPPRGDRRPVVVELFSSEGCSSCPPADTLLASLVTEQPVPGAFILGLELHVDYWDDLGWKDPFSSATFTAWQRRYAARPGHRGLFTPEAVIAGRWSTVGTDRDDVVAAIERATREPATVPEITDGPDAGSIAITLRETPARRATLELVVTEWGLSSRPDRGENRGASLRHAPVVRYVNQIADRAFAGSVTARMPPAFAAPAPNVETVALLRDAESLAILGAASRRAAGG